MNDNDTNDIFEWTGNEIKRIQAKKPSGRTAEEWIFLAEFDPSVMEEKGFPFDQMTVEHWKDLILANPIYLQYGPPVDELLKILTKEDFKDWDSYKICLAVMFEGEWLAEEGLLPMDHLTQEDFDEYFGMGSCIDAEDFWDTAPAYFPEGFPAHIKLPPRPPKDGENK